MSLSQILETYRTWFPDDADGIVLIQQAYLYAEKIHKGQERASGEPYITHLAHTALQLAQWRLDAQTIAAGLLHDSIEDKRIATGEIEKRFGKDVLFLIQGVTKLSKIKYRGQERSLESLRKMILAISKDLRVIFIKLADRLHNMKTLQYLPPQKQKRIALETDEVYAPLASRLGMQHVSGDLEDLAFPYLYPDKYEWIKEHIQETYDERNRYLGYVKPIVEKQLKKMGVIPLRIDYRAKRISSLYKKLLRYEMNLEHIHDLVAMRIIVKTIDDCYLVLGAIHQLWRPLPGRIKDYIALPKPNGYRSLHTTVFCLENRPTEFQIRTQEMHDEAEHGAAAHWFYESHRGTKQHKKGIGTAIQQQESSIVRQLKEWQEEFPGTKEFVEALKVDVFSDRIFVLTPQGEVIDLPQGATPIDFAYHIHSEVGNSCIGAKVNNKIVPLDHQLQSGDYVEILTQKGKKPSSSWLDTVRTNYARKKIRLSLKKKMFIPKKTEFKITCESRVGMIKDISSVFSRNKISITSLQTIENEKYPLIKALVDIDNRTRAEQILLKLKKIEGVKEISYKLI